MSVRVDKVAAQLRDEISGILGRRLGDPRVGLISVIGVDLSPDLRNAKVHVSALGDEAERGEAIAALEHARSYVRHELAAQMRTLRRIPDLRFVDDRNTEYALHIAEVIDQIHQEEGPDDGPEEVDEA
jgi:ribosome-binding factor A